jgi:hypothetical protein
MALPVLHDIGAAYMTKNNLIATPSSGGTFVQNGMAFGTSVVGAGTYKLPDGGLPMYVQATGTATITDAAGTTIGSVTSGNVKLFWPLSATTWANASLGSTQGFIDLPLTSWREVFSNDIGNITNNGGVLATDSTPTLEYTSGNTDSQLRVLWAASNVDPIAMQVTLPPDLDRTANIVVNIRQIASGNSDLSKFELDSFFDENDTLVGDTASDESTDSAGNTTITIAAADIPDTATTLSLELTPGTHGTDTVALLAAWITYTKI